jgi:5-methylthioadenosine/S-adenosylhomocysteine deaminase
MLPKLVQDDVLRPDNIFNHCTALPEHAWQQLAKVGVRITVDPRSDAQYALGDGLFAYQAAIDHGLRPGMGSDLETAYGGDMFTEMRVAFSLQRAFAQFRRHAGDAHAPAPVTVRALLESATIDGARCAGLATQIGTLTPGKRADIILIRTDDISLFPSNNAIGTVVHAAERAHVGTVIVDGVLRKQNGKLIGVDIARVRRAAEESLAYLFAAAKYRPDVFEDTFPKLTDEARPLWAGK